MTPTIITIDSIASTNSYLSSIATQSTHGTVVITHNQTAGRGQRGNTWEAEPGKNITLSILLKPTEIEARCQFIISEIISVAVVNTLRKYINEPERVSVKWPNDIYADNKKICGILIENSIAGKHINHSIAGIGLNINQTHFYSDAPNPVSLINIINKETSLDEICNILCNEILNIYEQYKQPDSQQLLHQIYTSMLWRRIGFHPYMTPDGTKFMARIDNIAPNGLLTLTTPDGISRTFAFKEVSAIIKL